MSKITNNASIHEETVDINRSAIQHRATWMGLIYKEALEAGIDPETLEGISAGPSASAAISTARAIRPSAPIPRMCGTLPRRSCRSWDKRPLRCRSRSPRRRS